ncbi:uncharacterized protein [Onthophagus taurus]|uniref:uncharacterized protein n=1 Tax=Onthophagus taurus TaxID=166361 RepID=UPI0039BDD7DC
MNSRIFFVLIALQVLSTYAAPRSGCTISINNDLGDPQPLVIKPNGGVGQEAFYQPTSGDKIVLNDGDVVEVACPNNNLVIDGVSGNRVDEAICNGGKFDIDGQTVYFSDITCKSNPYHVAKKIEDATCTNGKTPFEIGFEVDENRFLKIIDICFDEDLQTTLYSRFDLPRSIGGYQSGFPRPGWNAEHFTAPNVDNLYTRNTQRTTINALLGLPSSSYKYIAQSSDYFMSRGHLTAKADFVYGAHQRGTFYFLNAAPQWQTFNGRNWNSLEQDVRGYAADEQKDLVVYTGTHGVATLPHEETGEEIELYLYVNGDVKQIPVPQLYWKVVYEPSTKSAIAFVGVNNPYVEDLTDQIICNDICDGINWLSWDQHDSQDGYSYCCSVDELKETVKNLPDLDVQGLLQ